MPDADQIQQTESAEENKRKADVVTRHRPNNIAKHQVAKSHVLFRSENNIELRITVHSPEIIRLKYVLEGDRLSDFSYAVDPDFNPPATDFQLKETAGYFQITTDALLCRIAKKDMRVTFLNQDGDVLCEDKKPFSRRETLMKGILEVKITKDAPDEVSYFGLGDKIPLKNLRGHSFENWNTDAYEYERGDDPLYRSIPFYAALTHNGAYGIFLDNTYRSHFDFDSQENNTCSFSADGGCMNYYFIYGPGLTAVTERYTKLTGTPELPPMWALGYHQCRWSYFPESRVRELAETFRRKKIPCDAIYLDIDYMDDYQIFTWDRKHFPDPESMVADLKKQGFETVVMIDPGVKVDDEYFVYQQGLKNDSFCKRPDGELLIGPVWPPKVAFPDFTHPDVRDWWADLYEDLLADQKVSGVWNDMNEPALFEVETKTFPDNIRHHFDGQPSSHKKAHNIYGMQMSRASFNGIKKHNPDKRPFLLTRASFSGGQRYAALWTGDNTASWDHLELANEQCQRLSISGYSFVGTDIGGFVDRPGAELFTRWLQLSVFHPLFRNHTMGYNVEGAAAVKLDPEELQKRTENTDQEPWTFGEKFTDINRSVIELRYRLLHYLYTAFHEYVTDGTPILRPLTFYDQQDNKAADHINEFLFGDRILVSPVLDNKKREVKTYFPKGRWYDFRDNTAYEGKSTYKIDAPLDEIPFFIREGSVLPLREVMQYTQQKTPQLLELNVYNGESDHAGRLYEDEEEGYGYTDGDYRLTTFSLENSSDSLTLTAEREGSFLPKYKRVKINLIGLPFEPSAVSVDGEAASVTAVSKANGAVYVVETHPDFKKLSIR